MSALVIDTSVWIDFFNGGSHPDLEQALQESRAFVAPIVVAELLSGRLAPLEERKLTDGLAMLPLCETPLAHWIRVGRLRSLMSDRGVTISAPDAHVAQCALDLDAQLLTRDRIFERIAKFTALKLAG